MLEGNINPVICSPYDEPTAHWKLDGFNRPTSEKAAGRRPSNNVIPIPPQEQRERQGGQAVLEIIEDEDERENEREILERINQMRRMVGEWRQLPMPQRQVTSVTARLLQHWEDPNSRISRPLFFCQKEAIQTLIWLNEVAPKTKAGSAVVEKIAKDSAAMNGGVSRIAAKIATGGGKTTVMAMLIAYHAANHARNPRDRKYTGKFLVLSPGVTVRERLAVLLPSNPGAYYKDLVPRHLLKDVQKARVCIRNYHKFQPSTMGAFKTVAAKGKISGKQRKMLTGSAERASMAWEAETQEDAALRVCKDLIDHRKPVENQRILVINDEAHHCYLAKDEAAQMQGADDIEREEADSAKQAARIWFSGIRALKDAGAICGVIDLSATPQFLQGQGYGEGRLFPWVVSDFGLVEAIESGIVKMPRFPVRDDDADYLITRNIYNEVRDELRDLRHAALEEAKASKTLPSIPPEEIPTQLATAIDKMRHSYAQTLEAWQLGRLGIPPVMIVVCADTTASKMIFEHIAGYVKDEGADTQVYVEGKCDILGNVDRQTGRTDRPRTLLIDSRQMETGDTLSDGFKKAAARQVAAYAGAAAKKMDEGDLLREAMNTVGQKGKLGEQVRCIVSVGMLTEGWDAKNVTHVLGVRPFRTQLLCEQVVGRALRRISYDVSGPDRLLAPEYAEVVGIPFAFVAEGDGEVKPPSDPVQVFALPHRKDLEIRVPVIVGYRRQYAPERISANLDTIDPVQVTQNDAPRKTEMKDFVGGTATLSLAGLKERITETYVAHKLAVECVKKAYLHDCRDSDGAPLSPAQRILDLIPIVRQWLRAKVRYEGDANVSYFALGRLRHRAAESILSACSLGKPGQEGILAAQFSTDAPDGRATGEINFTTYKPPHLLLKTEKSHVNWAVCDSQWEKGYCKVFENAKNVRAYARNDHLGLEIPYEHDGIQHKYLPDFVVDVDDGGADPLHLVVEIKGIPDDKTRAKAEAARISWVASLAPHTRRWGRWAFVERRTPPPEFAEGNENLLTDDRATEIVNSLLRDCVQPG